jgi:hypothetical protein
VVEGQVSLPLAGEGEQVYPPSFPGTGTNEPRHKNPRRDLHVRTAVRLALIRGRKMKKMRWLASVFALSVMCALVA